MFNENPPVNLIIEYDKKARMIREKAEQGGVNEKIGFIPLLALVYNGKIKDNTITELVRIINAIDTEYWYAES